MAKISPAEAILSDLTPLQVILPNIDQWWCAPGSFGDAQYGVGHDSGVPECPIFQFLNQSNIEQYTITNYLTFCGFNYVDDAFCSTHKGDSVYRNWAQEVQQIYAQQLNCNPDSTEETCSDFINAHGPFYPTMKYRAFYSHMDTGNANIMKNDKCVKQMITYQYWGAGNAIKSLSLLIWIIAAN